MTGNGLRERTGLVQAAESGLCSEPEPELHPVRRPRLRVGRGHAQGRIPGTDGDLGAQTGPGSLRPHTAAAAEAPRRPLRSQGLLPRRHGALTPQWRYLGSP